MNRDRNQHSDQSGAPVDPRGPMSTQNFTRNSVLVVLEGIGYAKCSKKQQIQSQATYKPTYRPFGYDS